MTTASMIKLNRRAHLATLMAGPVGLGSIACLAADLARPAPPNVLNFAIPEVNPAEQFLLNFMQAVYREMFARAGIGVRYQPMPAVRGTLVTEIGDFDGEMMRSWEFGLAHPALVRIEEPVGSIRMVAYSTDRTIKLCKPQDLVQRPFKLGHRRDAFTLGDHIRGFVAPQRLFPAESADAGFRLLLLGAIDVFVEIEEYGEVLRSRIGQGVILNSGVVDRHNIHLYLNRKHEALVPQLTSILRQLRTEGFLDKQRNALRQSVRERAGLDATPGTARLSPEADICGKS